MFPAVHSMRVAAAVRPFRSLNGSPRLLGGGHSLWFARRDKIYNKGRMPDFVKLSQSEKNNESIY